MPAKKSFRVVLAVLTVLFCTLSCENKKPAFRELKVSVAPHVNAEPLNLKNLQLDINRDPGSSYVLFIVIYSYKQGKETISMGGESGFTTETGPAEIKVMVKIMEGDRIVKADFAEVSGNTHDELIRNLVKSVSLLIRN
ncbi:MAG TPA: hypothetical protein PK358_14915 [Spirochaetota bacterium]|nr:hypothetical protein [Spirochaetota bacterium]HPJ36129.1 hypothetical protein [Spirochaetota bacterium]